jgi:LDH2 family malate/lactate/ureidoglycolate dehydrogenase
VNTFSPLLLAEAASRALENAGLVREHSILVARVLVDADLRGHGSHGLMLLPLYLQRIREGGIRVEATPEWIIESPQLAILDAQGGPGQVAANAAAERCAELAHGSGISAVAVRNNNHIGMLAAYRMAFQKRGIIGMILNIAGASVAPPGGIRATLGNNAFCLITPTSRQEPFVIDFATGIVACGKIREALMKGNLVPAEWLMDRNGAPSTDPNDLDSGGAVPVFGGYKGLGLSMMIELLAGAVAGHTISPVVNRQRAHPDKPMHSSQFFIGINPSSFAVDSLEPFIEQLDHAVRSSYEDQPPRPVYFPDQQEALYRAQAERNGLTITSDVRQLLDLP